MDGDKSKPPTAVLVSGGIDSAVLVAELCEQGSQVFPLFVRGGLIWEEAELGHLRDFLQAIARPELQPLRVLELPVRDVYADHWCTTGRGVPDDESADDAVFLPGRNLFLISKAAIWCEFNGISTLALGSLAANPFADSTPEFDELLGELIQLTLGMPLRIVRPFALFDKAAVVRRGAVLPLEHTFSCINPVGVRHCGRCNKCAERRRGFEQAGVLDRTDYAVPPR